MVCFDIDSRIDCVIFIGFYKFYVCEVWVKKVWVFFFWYSVYFCGVEVIIKVLRIEWIVVIKVYVFY